MDTNSFKTVSLNSATAEKIWVLVDAHSQVLGRMASEVAKMIRGKHKPAYTPHVDCGDNVIVINADKIRFTGNKGAQKSYLTYSGYPGGQKEIAVSKLMNEKPERVVEIAVRGMLPKNKLGRAMFKKLFVYTGTEHPHVAQQPEEYKF